jgi:hypothetical protein
MMMMKIDDNARGSGYAASRDGVDVSGGFEG